MPIPLTYLIPLIRTLDTARWHDYRYTKSLDQGDYQLHYCHCVLFMPRSICFVTLQPEETKANFSVWHRISRVVPRTNFKLIQNHLKLKGPLTLAFIKVSLNVIMDRAAVVMIASDAATDGPFPWDPCSGRAGQSLNCRLLQIIPVFYSCFTDAFWITLTRGCMFWRDKKWLFWDQQL